MRFDEDIEAMLAGRAALTRYPAGATLFRPGDPSRALWLVRCGRVRVTRKARVVPHDCIFVEAETGWIIGAVGVMLSAPRSGEATVIEPMTTTIFEPDRLAELFFVAPLLKVALNSFGARWDRRDLPPLPDAYGPIGDDIFDPPPRREAAVLPLPR